MDPGDAEREDFPAGSLAAASAGVTTVVEHTHGWPVTTPERLAEKRAHLRGRSHVDYGLAAHVWPDQLGRLGALWRAGVVFFKIFTCETHGVPAIQPDLMLDVFDELAVADAACLVHCEDNLITARAERRLRAQMRDDPAVLYEWRSREAELVATGATALLARLTRVRATIAHVSHPGALQVLAAEQLQGSTAVAETCPQYLFLREDEVLGQGTLRKFTPPARIRSDVDEAAMWAAFNDGAINHLSTDHAPSTRAHKADGGMWGAHFGLPGLDSTLPLMIDAALTGRTSLERVVTAYADAPARRYRLSGKGRLAEGFDADLSIVDPVQRWVLTDNVVLSKAGWTPFAGKQLQGRVITTVVRGRTVIADSMPVNVEVPGGKFLPGPGAISG
jgi:dihydroorotase-like cyclic amidohydrolase